MQPDEILVLVDGSSLAYRSFFALLRSGLRRQDGTPTWAVYGFLNSLFDMIEKQRPHGLAVCFDLAKPTFRHEEFADYKKGRDEMPDDLLVQWPLIKETVDFLGIPLYELEGFEADDVIGTVATIGRSKGIKIQILTGDHDALQLVDDENEAIRVLVPGQKELIVYDRAKVFEKLGVWPEQVIDYKALCGDVSDNIPGVRGVGKVTAVQLLGSYTTIEGIYDHLDEIKSASLKQKLIDGKESAFISQRLATIVRDIPLEFDFDHCNMVSPPMEEVSDYFRSLEFKTMVNRLPKILSRFNEHSMISTRAASTESRSYSGGGTAVAVKPVVTATSAIFIMEPVAALAAPPAPNVVESEANLSDLVGKLSAQSIISLELELSGPSPLESEIMGYSFAWSPLLTWSQEGGATTGSSYDPQTWSVETAYVPVGHTDSGHLDPEIVNRALKPILENPAIGKITHNVKAKMNALSVQDVNLQGLAFDPMLASYIVNPDDKHSLKEQSQRLLGYSTVREAVSSAAGKKQLTISFAPVDKVATTSADDARVSLELTRYYINKLDDDHKYLLYEMELPLSAVLARMEQNGIALDLPYLHELSAEINVELIRLESEIYALAGHSFNINSPPQLQKVLFDELQLKTKGKTKTGFSTDATVLDALKGDHEIVSKILEYRQLSKLKSTYADALPRNISPRDHRVHGEFNQTTTATGRLSSSNPNLQNIPIRSELGRRIRRAFVPGSVANQNALPSPVSPVSPGAQASSPATQSTVLLSADYSQIELRLLGHMCADDILIDAFEKEQDIHARTSGEIFDIPIEEVTEEMRRIGKTLNFALIYRQGAYATAQDLGISPREARKFIDKYFARMPKVDGFLTRTVEEARVTGYVSTLWGRKRHFRFLNDRSEAVRKADERAACNAPIQGSAADLMKLAMIKLDQELQSRKMQTKLILQVHDELVLEVPEDEIELAKEVVLESMKLGQPLKLPLKVDVGIGKNWMDAK